MRQFLLAIGRRALPDQPQGHNPTTTAYVSVVVHKDDGTLFAASGLFTDPDEIINQFSHRAVAHLHATSGTYEEALLVERG